MNKRIIKKEWRELVTSARFGWSAIILYLLFLVAMLDGVQYFKSEKAIRTQATAATYQQWLDQGEKNPHSAAHYGFYAYKPVSQLAFIDKGLDDYLGNAVWLEAHNQNEVKSRYITDRLSLSRFGQLTPGLLFYFFVPLLLIIMGYNLVSREVESQTLRILLSTGLTSKTLIWSKALALFLASLVLVLPAFIILSIAGAASGAAIPVAQICILFLFLLLFYLFVCCTVVAASAYTRKSSVALVSLLAFWLLGIIIVPRLAAATAKKISPSPTAFAFFKAIEWDKENGLDGHDQASERGKKYEKEVLAKYGVDSISQLPVNFAGLSLQAGEEFGNQVFDKHFGELYNGFKAQDKIMSYSSLLSPFMTVRNITMGFAGTDLNRQALFVSQSEHYRRHIQKVLNDNFANEGVGKDFGTYLQGKELWQSVANFSLVPHNTVQLLKLQSLNIGVLLVWMAISIIFLFRSAHRLTI